MATSSLLLFSPTKLHHRHLTTTSTRLSPCTHSRAPAPFLQYHINHLIPLRACSSKKKKKKDDNSAGPPDRIISAACYLYPFVDGVRYGRYLLTQFPVFQVPLRPLVPFISLFNSFPLNSFLLFLTLYFAVVRNPSAFSRYVRFNTMQAIVLDVLLIFPDLIERSFNPRGGIGLDLVMSLDSTVFLFLVVSLLYGSTSCLLARAQAAHRRRRGREAGHVGYPPS